MSENAVAARASGYGVVYVPYVDDSGGVVIDTEPDAAVLS